MNQPPTPAHNTRLKLILAASIGLWLSACAVLPGAPDIPRQKELRQQLASNDCSTAEQRIKQGYKDDGHNAGLFHLQLAALLQYCGDYQRSADYLNRWNTEAPQLQSRFRAFKPAHYEGVFESYYNALNYLLLHQQAQEKNPEHLERARIFARQATIKLNKLEADNLSYDQVRAEDRQLLQQLLRVFEVIFGQYTDRDTLVYRDDAWVRYLNGVAFEASGQFDNARVNYEKAATLYETGFAEQFDLEQATNAAWYDTVRILKKAGKSRNRWQNLAEQKLDDSQRADIDQVNGQTAEILVVEHLDLIPERGQLKIHVGVNPKAEELVLTPLLFGNLRQQEDQQAWFTMMYADNDLFSIIKNTYRGGGFYALVNALTVKTVYLPGPAWDLVEDLGIVDALREGCPMIISVPYFPTERSQPEPSQLRLDNKAVGELVTVSAPSRIALQQQLLNSGKQLRNTLAVQLITSGLLKQEEGGLAKLLGCATNLSGAFLGFDTRSWNLLPHSIRFKRISVSPGKHTVTLESGLGIAPKTVEVEVAAGDIAIVPIHSLSPEAPGFYSGRL